MAYIKTLENKMLTKQDIEVLISSDYEGAISFLKSRSWNGDTVDEMLKNELTAAYSAASEVLDENSALDILLYQNDFHNLKTILKAIVTNVSWENMVICPSKVLPKTIEACIKNGNYSPLPDFLRDTLKNAYELLTRTMDAQALEIYVDNACMEALSVRAKAEKDEFIIGLAELIKKLSKLKALYRAKKAGKSSEFIKNASGLFAENIDEVKAIILSEYPDADSDSLNAFEKWCDRKIGNYIKAAKGESFSERPILAFLIAKSYEVKTVRIILQGIRNALSEEEIRERLI